MQLGQTVREPLVIGICRRIAKLHAEDPVGTVDLLIPMLDKVFQREREFLVASAAREITAGLKEVGDACFRCADVCTCSLPLSSSLCVYLGKYFDRLRMIVFFFNRAQSEISLIHIPMPTSPFSSRLLMKQPNIAAGVARPLRARQLASAVWQKRCSIQHTV